MEICYNVVKDALRIFEHVGFKTGVYTSSDKRYSIVTDTKHTSEVKALTVTDEIENARSIVYRTERNKCDMNEDSRQRRNCERYHGHDCLLCYLQHLLVFDAKKKCSKKIHAVTSGNTCIGSSKKKIRRRLRARVKKMSLFGDGMTREVLYNIDDIRWQRNNKMFRHPHHSSCQLNLSSRKVVKSVLVITSLVEKQVALKPVHDEQKENAFVCLAKDFAFHRVEVSTLDESVGIENIQENVQSLIMEQLYSVIGKNTHYKLMIVDCTGSMVIKNGIRNACEQLLKSVKVTYTPDICVIGTATGDESLVQCQTNSFVSCSFEVVPITKQKDEQDPIITDSKNQAVYNIQHNQYRESQNDIIEPPNDATSPLTLIYALLPDNFKYKDLAGRKKCLASLLTYAIHSILKQNRYRVTWMQLLIQLQQMVYQDATSYGNKCRILMMRSGPCNHSDATDLLCKNYFFV